VTVRSVVCSTDGTTDYTDLADARNATGTTWVRVSDGTPVELDRVAETTFEEEIRARSVGLFVGDDWLVSLSTHGLPAVERVWNMVEAEEGRLLGQGADFAVYRIVDAVVDGYFEVLDEIEDQIETAEDAVTTAADIERWRSSTTSAGSCSPSGSCCGRPARRPTRSPAATPMRSRRRPKRIGISPAARATSTPTRCRCRPTT